MSQTSTRISLVINGANESLTIEASETLLEVLRERLGLTGAKASCEEGRCGSCTVHLDGRPVNACIVLAADIDGRAVTTIEGLAQGDELHPVQQAFIDTAGLQCGYCTPGMIMTAVTLLEDSPQMDEAAWRRGLSGNICRCTGYVKIIDALAVAAGRDPGETASHA